MMAGTQMPLVPKLRFPEFRDVGPWKAKRLGEVAECYQPKTISIAQTSKKGPFSVYGANGIIGYFDRYNHKSPQVVIGCRGQCGNVILTQPNSWITGNSMVLNIDTHKYIEKRFLFDLMNSYDLSYLITGGAIPQITGEIKRHKITFPSLPEQRKIADCLTALDDLIRAEEESIAALNDHKRGLMQNLFPAPGETIPNLRFPEFRNEGDWEQVNLGDLLTLEYGSPLLENQRAKGSVPVIGSNGMVGFHDQALINGPAIVIGRKGSAGQVNWIDLPSYPIDTTFYVILRRRDCQLPFLALLLERQCLANLVSEGGVPGLNRNDVYAVKTKIPRVPEQRKIADSLGLLDDLIANQSQKIDDLRRHKRGLMQHLFPTPNRVSEHEKDIAP